jgi:DNA-binding NtrC family response regulator
MENQLFALLIQGYTRAFDALRRTLVDLSVVTHTVDTCRGFSTLIDHCQPHIVFAEYSLRDGSWETVLRLTEASECPASVIVVSAVPDDGKYVFAMENGAFDFVAPPFECEPLSFVVRSAALNTSRLRRPIARASCAR